MAQSDYTKIDEALIARAVDVMAEAKQQSLTLVTAESCTGGLIASVLSQAPGAGDHLHGGFVTYTKQQKAKALGVSARLLEERGAVCEPVARALAEGALERSPADIAISVTGVAGPDTDEDGNPVGLVYLAAARRATPTICVERKFGNLGAGDIRYRAVMEAFDLIERVMARR